MRVAAKHWVCYNGIWYRKGDVFEVATTDMDELSPMVDIVETPIENEPQEDLTSVVTADQSGEKPKRGRSRKV